MKIYPETAQNLYIKVSAAPTGGCREDLVTIPRKAMFKIRYFLLFAIFVFHLTEGFSANRYAVATGNWTAGIWATTAGGVAGTAATPTNLDDVFINSGVTVTINTAGAACLSLTFTAPTANNGITMAAPGSLAVTGAITMNSPTAGVITSTLDVADATLSAASITIPGSGTAGRFCTVSLSTGTINVSGNVTFSGTAAQARFSFTGAGTLNIGGNFGSGGTLATVAGSTINFNGSLAQTVGVYATYRNLMFSVAGAKTFTGTAVAENLTIAGTSTLTLANGLIIGGNLNVNTTSGTGASIGNGNTITVNGNITGSGTITGGTTGSVTGILTKGNWLFTGTITNRISLTMNSTTADQTFNGSIGLRSFTVAKSATKLFITTTPTIGGNLTLTSGHIEYNGVAQNILNANHPANLTTSGSGTKTWTITANRTIAGILTINSGTNFTTAGNSTIGVTGDTNISGTITLGGIGTKTFTGNVLIDTGGVWTESAVMAVNYAGNFQFDGATFTANTGIHSFTGAGKIIGGSSAISIGSTTISGTYTNNAALTVGTLLTGAGTLTNGSSGILNLTLAGGCSITTLANSGTINRSGTGTITTILNNFTNTGTINISGSGTISGITNNAGGTVNHSGSSTITSFNNATNSSILKISTTPTVPTITTLTVSTVGNTVEYNGTGAQTVKNVVYSNLTLSGTGTKTTTGVTVNRVLSMEGDATVAVSALPTYGAAATLRYGGTAAKNTGLEFPATFTYAGGVVIDNPLGVALNSARAISTTLTLTSGNLVTTAANLLSITNTATAAIVGGSSGSFIDGPLKWTLPASLGSGSSYNFPVGKGTTYLPFTLVNPLTGIGVVTAQAEAFSASLNNNPDATVCAISTAEYWSLVTAGNFTGSSLTLTRPTAISPLDKICGSDNNAADPYTMLEGTGGTYGVTGSNDIGTNRYFAFCAKLSFETQPITGAPFCSGSSGISVPFTYSPNFFFSAATFTAQLSDAAGSFAVPVSLQSIASNNTGSQSINVTIPPATLSGNGYRIRMVASTAPTSTSTDNGANLIITAAVPAQPSSITGNSGPCANTAGVTYSVTNVAGVTYNWSFPSDWVQTAGGTTNSVTVTTGTASGNVQVTPSNACGNGTAQTLVVSVVPAPAISTHPSTSMQSLCQNASATALSVTATGSGLIYQWYSNSSNSNSGGTLISGATLSSYTPLTNATGSLYYYCVVSGSCSPAATSNVSGAITVIVPAAPGRGSTTTVSIPVIEHWPASGVKM